MYRFGENEGLGGRKIYTIPLLVIGIIFFFSIPNILKAQSGWTLDVGAERSPVTINNSDSVWWSQHFEMSWVKDQVGGWFVGIENQERFGLKDTILHTKGYRRLGDWTISGGGAFAPKADFWFRYSIESELSRRIVGSVVISGAYRFMQYPITKVYQPQIALTWYHRRGEVQGRVFFTHNSIRDGYSETGLIQSSYRINQRLKLIGAVAHGDRIYDIQSLASGPASAWVMNGALHMDITRCYAIVIGGGFARENPQFKQQTVALSIRRSF
jgi:YaiO family outer membrane protein